MQSVNKNCNIYYYFQEKRSEIQVNMKSRLETIPRFINNCNEVKYKPKKGIQEKYYQKQSRKPDNGFY